METQIVSIAAACVDSRESVYIWHHRIAEKGQSIDATIQLTGPKHRYPVTCIAVSTNLSAVISGSEEGVLLLSDLTTDADKVRHRLPGHNGPIQQCAFAAGQTQDSARPQLALSQCDESVRVWDLAKGTALRVLRLPQEQKVQHSMFDAYRKNAEILLCSTDQVRVFKLQTAVQNEGYAAAEGTIKSCALSPGA